MICQILYVRHDTPIYKIVSPTIFLSILQISVMEVDRTANSGEFRTEIRGKVPPLVTTNFTAVDCGQASPRFIRSTLYSAPVSSELHKQTAVPFALCIAPFAELNEDEAEPPLSDMAGLTPPRCIRCKAYMCPFMQFIDGGRRFSCPFCKGTTEGKERKSFKRYIEFTEQ
jgi:protein transport protein SEC24